MSLSYRTRRRLKFWVTLCVTLCVIAAAVFSAWLIWIERYTVYTREGAKLDFSLSQTFPEGDAAQPPAPGEPVSITVNTPNPEEEQVAVEQTGIMGYYIDSDMLRDDVPGLMEKLKTLPAGTAVLMDMKTIKGSFYYDTAVGSTVHKDIDTEQINQLLELLSGQELHAIARIPAFRDWEYGLNNVPQGLPKKGGNGSLWMDEKNCYWLDPTKEGVLSYLIQIMMELKSLGFDEVVFTDFRFPDTDKITFKEDKVQALTEAAATLVTACASERFTVSFYSSEYHFTLPGGNTRLYIKDADAAQLPLILQEYPTAKPAVQLLFLTEANDTRFNDYCVLRPLENAI